MADNPKKIKNGGKGTLFGNLLRGALSISKTLSPNVIGAIANATGIGDVTKITAALLGDPGLTAQDIDLLTKEMDKDIIEMQEITKRWESDNKSQDWLPRNIRPLVVANFTILIDVVIISAMWGKPLGEAYLPILMTMGVTAIGGYFTLREYGKAQINKNK